MNFEVDGRRYRIEFEYPDKLTTVSRLVELNETGGFMDIVTGSVTRYYKDKEDKEKARKAALGNVIRAMPWSKNQRLTAWNAYLQRSPKNRYSYRFKTTN